MSPADDTYTTLLNFVSDSSQANRDIKTTTENLKKMEDQAKKVSTFTPAKQATFFDRTAVTDMKRQADEFVKAATEAGIRVSAGLRKGLRSGNITEADRAEALGIAEQFEKINELREAKQRELQETLRAHQTKISLYRREAAVLSKTASDIREQAQILRGQAAQIQGISQLAFGVGAGVAGGIFAFANKYASDAKVVTETVKAWRAAQDSLNRSGQRTGEIFAQAALPLLQKAADIAQKASRFFEQHPEIAQAALNAGLITAGLGAVGLAVSKGIKLYADQLYLSSIPLQLQAGNLQLAAAHEQLIAARLKAGLSTEGIGGGFGKAPAGGIGGALATGLTSPAASLALIVGFAVASFKAADALKKVEEGLQRVGGPLAIPLIAVLDTLTGVVNPLVVPIKNLRTALERDIPAIKNIIDRFTSGGGATSPGKTGERATGGSVLGRVASETLSRAISIYEDYKNEDLKLVQDHYNERQNIVADGLQKEAAENADFAADNTKIRANLAKSIASATAQYNLQEQRDEVQYAQQRAQVIRDGGKEIANIEQQLQERLRKLRIEHGDRDAELLAARDAVGLVKERLRYNRERSEETRQANLEIRQRRADLAQRLDDLQQQQEQERAQRLEDFKIRIAELQAQAKEQLAERATQHAAEIRQIREQAVAKIRELDAQFAQERRRRYDQFVQNLRDLDAGLLGERKLRLAYQATMLKELDAFLLAYKTKLASLSTATPTGTTANSSGGYAGYGLHLLSDAPGGGRGKTEYVLSGDVTELAERVLGGRISQQGIVALLSSAGGSRNNVVYNDSRRIDSRISNSDRQRMMDDTLGVLHSVIG